MPPIEIEYKPGDKTFYPPGTILRMPNGSKMILVKGKGWKPYKG